ncbi:MAG: TolC family protein [Magnetococcales bacterium]|nr:TolC family protein [Magnetococcales bacterium]
MSRSNKLIARPKTVTMPGKTLPVVLVLLLLSGCAVKPEPLTMKERNIQVFKDIAAQFARQTPPDTPITIDEAMARALKFNLEHRVKTMNQIIAKGMTSVASYKMLPGLAADAGYADQDRPTSDTGQLRTSTGSLEISWNVLDLGISYISAQQQADRVLIASELQRKAAHNLLNEVRSTFWRAIAAERLTKAIMPLKIKLNDALESSRQAEKEQLEPPADALNYQVSLLETLQKLQRLQKQISGARSKLAELMGLDPGKPFELVEQKETDPIDLTNLPAIEALEGYALMHRPELWEKDYKLRIKANETRKTILRLFPGLDFSQSREYDNTESYPNRTWSEFGVNITWNMLNLLSAPKEIALARDRERMEDLSRMALNMSVVVQVHIAMRNLVEARAAYDVSSQLSVAKEKLYTHAKAEQEAETANELDLISRESERILYLSHRDLAFAKLQNAAGAFLVSLGWDIIPNEMEKLPFDLLTTRIKENNLLVASGKIPGLSNIVSYSEPASDNKQNNPTVTEDSELESPEWIINDGVVKLKEKNFKTPLNAKKIEQLETLKPLKVLAPKPTSKPLAIIKDYQIKKALITAKKIDDTQGATKLTFIVDGDLNYDDFYLESPSRFVIDLYNAKINGIDNIKGFTNNMVAKIRIAHHSLNSDRVVIELKKDSSMEAALLSDESGSLLQVSITAKTMEQAKAELTTKRETPPNKPNLL